MVRAAVRSDDAAPDGSRRDRVSRSRTRGSHGDAELQASPMAIFENEGSGAARLRSAPVPSRKRNRSRVFASGSSYVSSLVFGSRRLSAA